MPVTVPQDVTTLLSYFQTGDTPTQDQFEELIRTMFYLYQQSVDAAEAAAASAAAMEAMLLDAPVAPVSGRIDYAGDDNYSELVGCTVTQNYGGNEYRTRIDFTVPFADTDYFFLYTHIAGSPNGSVATDIITKDTAYIIVDAATSVGTEIRFAIYPYSQWYELLDANNLLPAPAA